MELRYYERGKAMFQLKSCLDRLKTSQTNDSLSIPPLSSNESHQSAEAEPTTDLPEDMANITGGTEVEDGTNLEGPGEADDHIVIDADDNICDGKPEEGNRKLRAQFGRRRSHNEELCVASCGVIHGRERFYGSEAPNGVRVCVSLYFPVLILNSPYTLDFCYVDLSDEKITSWCNLARQ